MSYDLSFSPEFFLAEGEPYERTDLALNEAGKPISVWSAIDHWKRENPEDWNAMALEVFELKGEHAGLLMAEAVFDRIQETNTCSSLSSPVKVWIDAKGNYQIPVYGR